MKFELTISDENFKKLRTFLIENLDCDDETLTDIGCIKECFFLEDRHGNECEMRFDQIKVVLVDESLENKEQ